MISTEEQDRLRTALDERSRLTAQYRRSKHLQYENAYLAETRLRWFAADIRRCGPADSERMIAIVHQHYNEWLRNAAPEARALALELVATRIRQIREHDGMLPFSDPLPHQDDDVFQIVRKILG